MSEPTAAESVGPGAASHAPLSPAEVASIVPAKAPPPPPNAAYMLSLATVALAGTVLALVYVALVAAAAGGLVWHVTVNTGSIGGRGSEGRISARAYAGLLLVFVAVLVILLRPLVAGKRPPAPQIAVSRDREPAFHAFVERVAGAVGAPVPAAIEMDDDVNASARFRRGLRSFLGNDLTLTVGAPLVAGLSVAELASVVAHELGHFRQGAGMRLTYVASTLKAWFARAAFERDRWDDAFEKVAFAFGLVQVASWLVRKLFHGMVLALHAVESLASRRMEIDADDHSISLVGGAVTASALREVVLLDAARGRAFGTVREEYRRGRLPEDVPALVAAWRGRLTAEGVSAIVRAAFEERTRAGASHPCVRERVERAERAPAGPLACVRPATDLLRDPGALFREATARRWAVDLGEDAARCAIVPATDALATDDAVTESRRAFARWSQGTVSYLVLPRVGDWLALAPPPPETARDDAVAVRAALTASAPAARGAIQVFDSADTRVVEAHRVEAVLSAKGKVARMENVTLVADRTADGVRAAFAEAETAQRSARATIEPALGAVARRFAAARTLSTGEGADSGLVGLATVLAAADAVVPIVERIRVRLAAATDLARERAEFENRRADEALVRLAAEIGPRLDAAHRAAAGGPQSLRDALGPLPPPSAPAADVVVAAETALGGFYRWWFETAAAVAVLCEAAETAAGLEPLPEPEGA